MLVRHPMTIGAGWRWRFVIAGVAVFTASVVCAEPADHPPSPASDAADITKTPPKPLAPKAPKPDAAQPKAAQPDAADAERVAVWNSPAMLVARAWLADYFRVSGLYTEDQARAYLAGLEQLDADSMRLWLAQLEQRMARVEQQRQGAENERLYQRARASAVQQQRAINLAKLSTAQAVRARFAQQQIDSQRRFSEELFRSRAISRDQTFREQIANQNLRTQQILNLLDRLELRADLRARRGDR